MEKDVLMKFLQEIDKDFIPFLSQKVDLSSYCDKLLSNAQLFASYSDDENISGLVVLYANDFAKRYAYIPLVAVRKDCRGRGLAKELLVKAVSYVKKMGGQYKMYILGIHTNNPIALRFYQKLGFVKQDERNGRTYLEMHF